MINKTGTHIGGVINLKNPYTLSLILAISFHFTHYFSYYGPEFADSIVTYISFLAPLSIGILLYLMIRTDWKKDIQSKSTVYLFYIFIAWIVINFGRSALAAKGYNDWKPLLLNSYLGISMLPIFFFIQGVRINNFHSFNKIIVLYTFIAWPFSMIYYDYFELQTFLLMSIFYVVMLFPMQGSFQRLATFLIAFSTLLLSTTNRAALMRISLSYVFVLAGIISVNTTYLRKIIKVLTLLVLLSPAYFLYQGLNGNVIFETYADNGEKYSQQNLKADTRTFLYYEVFLDLQKTRSFVFGKGMGAGYASKAFETNDRKTVEVGFLQILIKTGIVGFVLYMIFLLSAIYRALFKSNNIFSESMGLFLAGYILIFFLENVIAFNLLNILVWYVIGVCHSEKIRSLSDPEIKYLYVT